MTRALSDEAKIIRGTLRKSRRKAASTRPGWPALPDDMSDAERACCLEIMALLASLGLLSEVDAEAVRACARSRLEIDELTDIVRKQGRFYECRTEAGAIMVRTHPSVALLAAAETRLRLWLGELGLTPVGRLRFSDIRPRILTPTVSAPVGKSREMTGTADDFFYF